MAEAGEPASFDPRLARVVKIKVAEEARAGTIGSGHLFAPGLVLTARHVLWRGGDETRGDYPPAAVRVRAATGPSAGASLPVSRVVRLGEARGVDVAVLVVPGLVPAGGTSVVGARFTATRPVPGCWMIGYPEAAHQDAVVGPEYVGVSLLPVSGAAHGRVAVRVDTPPAREAADWRGLSGSGVVDAQNRLLGVLVSAQVKWEDRLAVVPVEAIAVAARERAGDVAELGPLLELPVVEETGEDPLLDQSKFPPRLRDLRGESLFEALHFRNRVVPFIEDGVRDRMVEEVLAWIRGFKVRPDLRVALVTGPAGVGKSRLAAEICDRLAASDPWWRAGFAEHAKLITAPVPTVPTVVVVDYPERHPEALGRFLTRVREERRRGLQAPVRVLLLARDRQSWLERARAYCTALPDLITHEARLDLQRTERHEWDQHAAVAYRAFCEGFGLSERSGAAFALDPGSGLDRPLLVHAAALLAAWSQAQTAGASTAPAPSRAVTNEGRLLDDLINAEVKRLLRLRRGDDPDGASVFTSDSEVREALCVVALTGPVRAHLPELLACTEAFGPNGNTNRIPASDALLDCFSTDDPTVIRDPFQRALAPVEPDLIAAHLLATTPGRTELIKRLVASDTLAEHPAYQAQMIGALAQASRDYPEVGDDLKAHLADALADLIDATGTGDASLAGLLTDHLEALVAAAVAAAADQDLTPARRLAAALDLPATDHAHSIGRAAAEVYLSLPYPHPGLAALGVALTRHALAHEERIGLPAAIAAAADTLGNWLSHNGQRSEALVAAQRAVDLREELVADSRAAHLPDLARSYWTAAYVREARGYEADIAAGIEWCEKAIELYRDLAAAEPDAFTSSLEVVEALRADLAARIDETSGEGQRTSVDDDTG